MKKLLFVVLFIAKIIFMEAQDFTTIQGTNIQLIAPNGFLESDNFKGLQNPDDPYSMIMVVEIPGPYEEIIKGFTSENLNAQSMNLYLTDTTKLDEKDAMYLELEQDANGIVFSKSIMIYGDENNTTLINGVCLKKDTTVFAGIVNAVKNASVDRNLVLNPRADLDFEVDETAGNAVFVSVMGNALLLNRDGLLPTESEDRLNIVVDKSFAPVMAGDYEAFSINRIAQYDGDYEVDRESVNGIEVDGLDGIELLATNQESNEEMLYQVILFLEEGGYIIFMATFNKEYPETFDDIRAVLNTFKRK